MERRGTLEEERILKSTSARSAVSASFAPRVTIVVCCRNEAKHIEATLGSALLQQGIQGGFEVVVADGMSEDGTREILSELAAKDSRIRLIDNLGRIASCGLNSAIAVAKGAVIVRMDAHTEYDVDYVRSCLDVQELTNADNVGGPARTKASGYVEKAIAAAYHSAFSAGGAKFHDPNYEGPLDTVTYGCWRRETFARFGSFDEELARNQDDEHNLRIILGGGRIWQSPRIKSWYHPRRSLSALFRQYMQYGYWKVRVIQKHHLAGSVRQLIPAGFLVSLVLAGVLGIWLPLAAALCLSLTALYLCASVAASILTAFRNGLSLLPVLPLVFWCYHFGYGLGFLFGVFDFLLMGSRPRASSASLTR